MELKTTLGSSVGKGLVGQKTLEPPPGGPVQPWSPPCLCTTSFINKLKFESAFFSANFLNQRAQWGLKVLILSLCPPGMGPWARPHISSSSWPAAGTWPSAQLTVRVPCGPGPSSYHTDPTTQRAAPWVTPLAASAGPSWHIPHWKTWYRASHLFTFPPQTESDLTWVEDWLQLHVARVRDVELLTGLSFYHDRLSVEETLELKTFIHNTQNVQHWTKPYCPEGAMSILSIKPPSTETLPKDPHNGSENRSCAHRSSQIFLFSFLYL